jgi:uncharacterized protein YkwD
MKTPSSRGAAGGGASRTAAIAAAWLLAGCGAADVPLPSLLDPAEAATVGAINAVRAVARNCGSTAHAAAAPIAWHPQAASAALAHAQWLQQNNLFSHTGAGGSTPGQRLTAAGYAWLEVGENLAAGQPDLAAALQDWLASQGHCAILMHPSYVHAGLAMVPGSPGNSYRSYWVLVMARQQ